MPTKDLPIRGRQIVNLTEGMLLVAGTSYLVSAPTAALVVVAEVADGEQFPDGGHPLEPHLEIEARAGSTLQARGGGIDCDVAVTEVA